MTDFSGLPDVVPASNYALPSALIFVSGVILSGVLAFVFTFAWLLPASIAFFIDSPA